MSPTARKAGLCHTVLPACLRARGSALDAVKAGAGMDGGRGIEMQANARDAGTRRSSSSSSSSSSSRDSSRQLVPQRLVFNLTVIGQLQVSPYPGLTL